MKSYQHIHIAHPMIMYSMYFQILYKLNYYYRLVHLPAVRLEKWGEGIGDIENTKVVGFDYLLCFFTL